MRNERVGLHKLTINKRPCIISTVKLGNVYETIVMSDDGYEYDLERTKDLDEAKANHNRLVNKWNDELYKSSLLRLMGVPNTGQMVKTIKAC